VRFADAKTLKVLGTEQNVGEPRARKVDGEVMVRGHKISFW
jgi:hypothetical protein